MKRFFKILLIALLVAFVLIQLYPRPVKNSNSEPTPMSIDKALEVPAPVMAILKTSCYDCHSNNTYYPWYANLQPVAMWLNDHVVEGKGELNFSEFGSYRLNRQYRKLEEMGEEVSEGEMPLSSYTIIHRNASLDDVQKKTLQDWVTRTRSDFAARYPADSLVRKK